MIILFTLVNLLLIAFFARKEWKQSALSDSTIYWSSLTLKLITGIVVGMVYKYYYESGDTLTLFDDACKLTKLFYLKPFLYFNALLTGDLPLDITDEPRSVFFISIISLVNLITHDNYWLTSLWFSFFSFTCSYRLVTKLDSVFPSARTASRIALLFTPSVVFWSSGIIKETIAFGAVTMLAVYFLSLMRGDKLTWRSIIGIILFMYLLLSLKYYWAAVLIPSMITAVIIRQVAPKRFLVPWFILVFFVLAFLASFTHPNFYLSRFLQVMVENHDIYIVRSQPDKIIHYYNLTPDWSSIVINSLWALWSGLFRPMIFEASSFPVVVAALENLLLLGLVIWKLKFIRMPKPENQVIVLTALVYVVVLCMFLALSTPNFGTLSRFRVGFLPFFVLMILVDHPILVQKSQKKSIA